MYQLLSAPPSVVITALSLFLSLTLFLHMGGYTKTKRDAVSALRRQIVDLAWALAKKRRGIDADPHETRTETGEPNGGTIMIW